MQVPFQLQVIQILPCQIQGLLVIPEFPCNLHSITAIGVTAVGAGTAGM